jgi:hypothetical protein
MRLSIFEATHYGRECTLHVGKFLIFVRFIKIREKRVKNPTIVPLLYDHVCPKYSEIKVPVIPNCLSLNINPSCHTLSKAFDTSRKIAHLHLYNVTRDVGDT